MSGKFEIYKDARGEFRFRLKAENGETILSSEGYKDRSSAKGGVASVKKNADLLARFDRRVSSNGKPYFVLKAGNHQVIGSSEMYSTEEARDNGIKSVMHVAPLASVVELPA